MKPVIDLAENITLWFKSQAFFDYFNWYLAQPSGDYTGILIVFGVLVVAIILVVTLR